MGVGFIKALGTRASGLPSEVSMKQPGRSYKVTAAKTVYSCIITVNGGVVADLVAHISIPKPVSSDLRDQKSIKTCSMPSKSYPNTEPLPPPLPGVESGYRASKRQGFRVYSLDSSLQWRCLSAELDVHKLIAHPNCPST